MSRHRQQRRRTPMRPSVDRPTAAVLLRAARRADAADDAIEWASQTPGAWYGHIEVRPIMEFDEEM